MLKQLRRKFIITATAIVFAVMLLMSCAIAGTYYKVTVDKLDDTLTSIQALESDFFMPFGTNMLPSLYRMMGSDPESRYKTRYFSALCDGNGRIVSLSMDYIASVSESDACTYAGTVFSGTREKGFKDGYRFLKSADGSYTRITFLNATTELASLKALALVCLGVVLVSVLLVFVLIVLFSKRAIAPYTSALAQQKRFITDAGHELKTPLTSISTSADVLSMEYEDNEWITNIREQCVKLAKLIGNLVTLSRLDEEQPLPERTDFSLSEAAWEIAEPFVRQAEAVGKRLKTGIDEGVSMNGDRSSIQQMISVLLDNAVKYADANSEITLRVYKQHAKAVLEVMNHASGADFDTGHIFDRFYRPDASRSSDTGGYGIGLSIARAVTEAHGGKITASVENGTVTFRAVL